MIEGFGYKWLYTLRSIPGEYIDILHRRCRFYNSLSYTNKKKFERKLNKFISSKEFIAREMEEVTTEMKVLIAASAVQLTFGISGVYMKHFKKILVYPDSYYSNINQQYHKGEVNPYFGVIVLSWKNFEEGINNPNSGVNLGLHEMAHAIKIEDKIQRGDFFFDDEMLKEWEEESYITINKMRKGEATIFRQYAATNMDEFFACAVEYFFERPYEFARDFERLYMILAHLLQQDPRNLMRQSTSEAA